jgi:hypothetical protein
MFCSIRALPVSTGTAVARSIYPFLTRCRIAVRLHASKKGVVHMQREFITFLGAAAAAWKRAKTPATLLRE